MVYLQNNENQHLCWARFVILEMKSNYKFKDTYGNLETRQQNESNPYRNFFKADSAEDTGIDFDNTQFGVQSGASTAQEEGNIMRIWHPLNKNKYKIHVDKKVKLAPSSMVPLAKTGTTAATTTITNQTGQDHKCISGYLKTNRIISYPKNTATTSGGINNPFQDIRVFCWVGAHQSGLTVDKVKVQAKFWEYFNP